MQALYTTFLRPPSFQINTENKFPLIYFVSQHLQKLFSDHLFLGTLVLDFSQVHQRQALPPCSGRRSGVGLMQGPPLQPSMEIPSRVGQVKTFVMGRDVFELGLSLKAQVFEL